MVSDGLRKTREGVDRIGRRRGSPLLGGGREEIAPRYKVTINVSVEELSGDDFLGEKRKPRGQAHRG